MRPLRAAKGSGSYAVLLPLPTLSVALTAVALLASLLCIARDEAMYENVHAAAKLRVLGAMVAYRAQGLVTAAVTGAAESTLTQARADLQAAGNSLLSAHLVRVIRDRCQPEGRVSEGEVGDGSTPAGILHASLLFPPLTRVSSSQELLDNAISMNAQRQIAGSTFVVEHDALMFQRVRAPRSRRTRDSQAASGRGRSRPTVPVSSARRHHTLPDSLLCCAFPSLSAGVPPAGRIHVHDAWQSLL